MQKKSTQVALMVCTAARGGMRSVVEAYERDGLFEDWHFQSLWTHCEGNALTKIKKGLSAYGLMFGLLLRRKVSFMHVHAAMRGSFWRKSLFILTARLFGVPCIMHLHGSEMKTFYNSLSSVGKRAVRWCLEHVEVVIVLSESWRHFVAEAAPKANISMINNYVTLPEKPVFNPIQNKFDVLFLGVLGQRKGIYDLLACWPAVLKTLPHARLLIGGNGEVEKAKAIAEALNISSSVEFLGWMTGEQKIALLKNADVFVLPSYNEGLPMSILEAMSWAKPVVSTTVGGIPELISHGKDGFLIAPGSQDDLCNFISILGLNTQLRDSIGEAARQRIVNYYSNRIILPKLTSIYVDISTK